MPLLLSCAAGQANFPSSSTVTEIVKHRHRSFIRTFPLTTSICAGSGSNPHSSPSVLDYKGRSTCRENDSSRRLLSFGLELNSEARAGVLTRWRTLRYIAQGGRT